MSSPLVLSKKKTAITDTRVSDSDPNYCNKKAHMRLEAIHFLIR